MMIEIPDTTTIQDLGIAAAYLGHEVYVDDMGRVALRPASGPTPSQVASRLLEAAPIIARSMIGKSDDEVNEAITRAKRVIQGGGSVASAIANALGDSVWDA